MASDQRLTLRPSAAHSAPFIVLVALLDVGAVVMVVGLAFAHNPGGSLLIGGMAAALSLGTLLYYRNAMLWVDAEEVGKTDLLGRRSVCRRDDLLRLESHFAPQPTLEAIRKDGRRAFRVNTRLWDDEQLNQLRASLKGS